jgi:hypothetical protein
VIHEPPPQWKGQRVGAQGLELLGMPLMWTYEWDFEEYVYSGKWFQDEGLYRPGLTYAALHAELLVLEAMGLIQVIETQHPESEGFVLWVKFRYTDAGALAVWELTT